MRPHSTVRDEMSRTHNFFHPSLLLACSVVLLALVAVQALPQRCAPDDEECHDRRMHPDLPPADPSTSRAIDGEKTNAFWREQGVEFIAEKLAAPKNTKRAKNVIMFLGDGMGLTTIAAARNLLGGEEQQLAFDRFPYTGLSKTYSVNKIVPDSACTATAYLCGVKARQGTIGLNGKVSREDCHTMLDTSNHVYSIAKWAMDAGKWAGVVTTTRITHASPAGVYAHIADRDWENDRNVAAACGAASGVQDIAQQLVRGDVGSRLKLIMGGGRKHFRDQALHANGSRSDGLDLIAEYQEQSAKNVYVETREQLMAADLAASDRLMGLFQDDHLMYHLETDEHTSQPTLEEMTRKALEYLDRETADHDGYFVFIEGGRIDHAHHDNMARLALDETLEFSKAIQAARNLTSEEDTLIVVTADHSHAFSFSGYPYRGSDIFGQIPAKCDDGLPQLTLNYANGPSFETFFDVANNKRRDPTSLQTSEAHDVFPATFPLDSETHGGEDVAVFASGPWAHLFTGVYEQNTIPHIMGFAACLGDGLTACAQ